MNIASFCKLWDLSNFLNLKIMSNNHVHHRWRRVNGQGPPLHPKGDGSQCTGVVLSKTTRKREKNLQVQTFNMGGARRSHYLRGCVRLIFGQKVTCVFEFVFLPF
jgi:hypothetical protein